MKKHIFLLASIVFTCITAFSQSNAIRGFAYDKETGDPLIFTNVFLEGTTIGGATDVNGYFSIAKFEPGTYTLIVQAIGFSKYSEEFTITADQIINKKIYVEKSGVELKTVEISSEKQEALTQVKTGVTKITPKEIKALPSVGGEPDLAQYIQVLPGVVFTGDQGGQLYIRGGSPIQNKVLLDGMIVYSPFHSIGLFSVFDNDLIRNADVYTGGFPAQYGGRISSVIDITTIDGNKKEHEGKFNATPFGAKVFLHGPMKKLKENGGSSSSFVLSAKTSYLDQTSKVLYNYVSPDGLPFKYTDLYGKLSFNGGNGSRVNLFGFNFTDEVNYLGISRLGWKNRGGGANFVLVPSESPVLIEGHFSISQYDITLDEPGVNRKRESGVNGFDLGFDFKNFQGNSEIKYGLEVNGYSTRFKFFNSFDANFDLTDNTTELSGYVDYKFANGLLVINPGLHVHYYASLSEASVEPRLGLKYNISETFRLKAAGGLYSQNLIAGNSDRDVVNLFYGYISSPENLPETFVQEDGRVRKDVGPLQKSTHGIFGFEYDLTNKLSFNVESYIKRFNQLANINRNKIYEDNAANQDIADAFKKDYIIETGTSRGIDFVMKYTTPKFYFWTVYSIGKVDRYDGLMTYAPVFDRRHNVNLLSTYKLGEDNSWEISARWNYGSPLPFTQTDGFYEEQTFNDGANTDVTQSNGDFSLRLARLNGGRLTPYHRMDVNVKKTIGFEKSELELNLGVTNIYNRDNIFFVDRVTFDRVNQLPILPSFGASYIF